MSGREGGGGAVGKIEQSKTKEQKANRERECRKENESKKQILSMDADLVPLYVCVCVCNRNRYKDMNI